MAEVDSLTIRIKAETGSTVAQLKQITQLVEKLNSATNDNGWKSFTKGFSKLGKATENVEKLVSSLKKLEDLQVSPKLQNLGDSLKEFSKSASSASRTVKKLEKATKESGADNFAKKWRTAVKAIEAVNKGLSSMGRDLYASFSSTGIIADLDGMTGAISKNIPILGELVSAWKSAGSQIKNIVLSNASLLDKAANLMLVKVSLIVRTLYSLAKMPFGSASMGLTRGIVGTILTPLKNLGAAIADAKKRWDRFVSSIGRIAIYRMIRSAIKEIAKAIKEGVDNLYMWGMAWKDTYSSAAKFVNSMDKLTTAFLYLKNSIGAAVSPLIDIVAPVIDALVDKFVALANAINQAIAALSGAAVWRRALKYQYSYAEAANKTTKALKRTVLAFDELNRLDDNNKGGSGDNLDYSKMFEEAPVDDWLAKILESSSWRILGTGIASKINETLANLNWDSIESSARIWARRFGSLLDGALMGISMPLLGKSLAEGLNTAALSLNTFFKEFHFEKLGQNLSDGFESFINNLDWAGIGQALTQKWKAMFELLIGFKDVDLSGLGSGIVTMFKNAIENIPISEMVDAIKTLAPKLATEIGIAINGIFTETNAFINGRNKSGGIDAFGLGSAFANSINNMLAQIDPKEAGIFLSNGIKKIIEFATGALKTTKWGDLNTWVSEMITSLFENIDLKQGVQNAIDLASKIVELLTTIVNSIPWDEIGDAIANADTSELKAGIKKLFESVFDGLERSGFMDEVATGVATYFALKLGGAIAKALPSILTAKTIMGGLGGAGGSGLLASFGGFSGMFTMDMATVFGAGTFTEIAAYIGTGLVASLAAWFGGQKIGNLLGKWLFPDDAEFYENFHWFGEGGLLEAVLDETKFELESFGSFFREKADNLALAYSNMWDKMQECDFPGVISAIGDAWREEHPLLSSGLDAITTKCGELKVKTETLGSTWRTTLTNMRTNAGSAIDKIKEKFDSLITSFTGGISDIANSINSLSNVGKGLNPVRTANVNPRINYRASGGTVDRGDLFIAGEAGPELVTSFGGESTVMNMDQIISTIAQSVALASGGGDITIPISLDGGILDTVIVTAQQRKSLRSGR